MSYEAWVKELNEEITQLGRHVGRFHLVVDSKVAYRLGWGPHRTARALMGYSVPDRERLLKAQGDPATDLVPPPIGAV